MHYVSGSVFALILFWSLSAAAAANRIEHHQLEVSIYPQTHSLSAKDIITIAGGDSELQLYLGTRFNFLEISQGSKSKTARYSIRNWNPEGPPLAVSWQGSMPEFTGYGVSIIRPDLVELSGFCGWFPTIEPLSQAESFTYTMDLEVVITAQLFGLADLPDRYFAWYRERFLANEREALIVALSDLYHDHAGSVISRMEFTESLQESLGTKLAPFFQHWFDQPGFQPIYRADTT